MSEQHIPYPKELWENLLNINPQHFNDTNPDIDMLRDYLQKYSSEEASKFAKLLFQKAMDNWDDEQMREFVDLLTESQVPLSARSEELRRRLIKNL